jgi:hypothetical protein
MINNSNSIGGGLVLPRADLGQLQGLEKGGTNPVAMVDGKAFNGAKAYKDSKVYDDNMHTCNSVTVSVGSAVNAAVHIACTVACLGLQIQLLNLAAIYIVHTMLLLCVMTIA